MLNEKFGYFKTNNKYVYSKFIYKCHTGCGKTFSYKTLSSKGLAINPFLECPFCGNKR